MKTLSIKRVNSILLFSVLTCVVLYYAKKVLIPLSFAVFFAMLFAPMCNWLEERGLKRVITSALSLLITLGVGFGIVFMVFSQGKNLTKKFPVIKEHAQKAITKSRSFIDARFGLNEQKQDSLVGKQLKSASSSTGSLLKRSFVSFTDFITASVLTIIFMFLFLYQREKYHVFFLKLFKNMPVEDANRMIERICRVSQKYLRGRLISIGIFTVCFTVGFLIVGLENAFLLAFIASVLTIIPYVGSIIGGLLPFAVALVTNDDTNVAIGALAVVAIVQGFDNYFIEPYLIGGEVNLSGFATILILVVGSALWGISGMILFIPILGVVKIIFDTFPELQPYGFLIGDQKKNKTSRRVQNMLKSRFKIPFS